MPRRPTSPTPARTAGAASTASEQRLNDLRKAGDLKWFQVWDTAGAMPTAGGEGGGRRGGRAECRADILEIVRRVWT
ncbi:hypothetical protein [Urbifossiella limnaea]|uniref:hypothetical protein n=1 Tax=Urbifossiella limnaea TaxID=2528023 RepID=UPI0011A3F1D6|nr:hypothetical protein [Urbifossiella limnaea]